MSTSLGKQFSQYLDLGDFHSANQIIKKARTLKYPDIIITSWENSLLTLESGLRHPLDCVLEPNVTNHHSSLQLGPNLREALHENIAEYYNEINANPILIDQIVEHIFNNLDLNDGEILVPDLTSFEPAANLIHYSVDQYSRDCPDVCQAVERGLVLSELDHFLRSGLFEIIKGRRYSSIGFSYQRNKYHGKILYIVDDFNELTSTDIKYLNSTQLEKFTADIFSVKHNNVFTNSGVSVDIDQYLYQNISEHHNLCVLLKNKVLLDTAIKWLIDIKLEDRKAIFGYSRDQGIFCPGIEYSQSNMLTADITNGCIIVNSIEMLSVIGNLKGYETAHGFYHALVLYLKKSGVDFILKQEVLSQTNNEGCFTEASFKSSYWSPFYWSNPTNTTGKSLLTSIRTDFIKTWVNLLPLCKQDNISEGANSHLLADDKQLVVKLNPIFNHSVAVLIPFRDKVHLLEDCVESLMKNKEDVYIKVYAINNNSIDPNTFRALNLLKAKYADRFACIDSPGEFNYAKINNDAAKLVDENHLLFLNNDIIIESGFSITTLLKTHYFYDAIITGSKLLYPSGKIQHNGLATSPEKHIAVLSPFRGQRTKLNHKLSIGMFLHPWDRTHECSAVTAACMLIQKDDFLSIGGFDEDFKIAYNDVDLCFRSKEKYISRPIICSTELKITHLESESRGADNRGEKAARLYFERTNLVNRHEDIFTKVDPFLGFKPPSDDIHRFLKSNYEHKFQDCFSAPRKDINLQKLAMLNIYQGKTKNYSCIFVHYDKDALITDDCIHHLAKLAEYCDLYFVSSSEKLAELPDEIQKIKPFCKQILIRKNSGYDFGCWSHVVRENYDQLCDYEGVLFANDSNWGPLNDFSDTFEKINHHFSLVDFIGLTSSTTPTWHIQSFFVMYSKRVFNSSYFKQHWFNIGVLESKFEIIMNYEVGWCTRLRRLGFEGISLYGKPSPSNPTHVDWQELLQEHYPYIKKELIRDNPLQVDLSDLPVIISAFQKNWSSFIVDYLERYGKESQLLLTE